MDWRVANHIDYTSKGGEAVWDDGVLPVSLKSLEQVQ